MRQQTHAPLEDFFAKFAASFLQPFAILHDASQAPVERNQAPVLRIAIAKFTDLSKNVRHTGLLDTDNLLVGTPSVRDQNTRENRPQDLFNGSNALVFPPCIPTLAPSQRARHLLLITDFFDSTGRRPRPKS